MTNWMHYWSDPTVRFHEHAVAAGDCGYSKLDHTASNMFGKLAGGFDVNDAKVQPGDVVYCLTSARGKVRLLGKLIVGRVVNQRAADGALKPLCVFPAKWHLLARAGTATSLRFDLALSISDVKKIEFISNGNVVGPKFVDGFPDKQTFRSVRELTARSASLFDASLK